MLDYHVDSGVGRTYRYLNTTASAPIFWFGFGLSYTSFNYSTVTATVHKGDGEDGPSVDVSFSVTNTGKLAGHEVVQLIDCFFLQFSCSS